MTLYRLFVLFGILTGDEEEEKMKLKKDNLVVSVETEPGSRGAEIAEELAGKLGIPCYGQEILEEASKISGISMKLLKRYEERNVHSAYKLDAEDESDIILPPARMFIMAQIAACRHLAEKQSCVLVDHHANTALGGMDDHVRVFVHADREAREERYAFEKHITPEKAKKDLPKEERRRRRYYRSVSRNWGKAGSYDLTVNSTHNPPQVIAGHIVDYLQNLTEDSLVHPTQARKRSA